MLAPKSKTAAGVLSRFIATASTSSGVMCVSYSEHKFTAGYCKEKVFKKRRW